MPWLEGFSYGNFMRVMTDPRRACTLGSQENMAGTDGLAVTLPMHQKDRMTVLMMTQKTDAGTFRDDQTAQKCDL